MYHSLTTGYSSPSANIAVNRNRLKHYTNGIVYLKGGTHFEIELFNPTQTKVLAQIKIDGADVSQTGISIRPGERVFLDRWIDSPHKFLFETYESTASSKVIEHNGKVDVSFYSELTNVAPMPMVWTYGSTQMPSFGGTTVNNLSTTIIGANASYVETGRTEKGENSNQKFSSEFSKYNTWPINLVNLQILPEGMVPIESNNIRNYCSNCGQRHKKSNWKFCPACGTKI
jgi:hypothetical protein